MFLIPKDFCWHLGKAEHSRTYIIRLNWNKVSTQEQCSTGRIGVLSLGSSSTLKSHMMPKEHLLCSPQTTAVCRAFLLWSSQAKTAALHGFGAQLATEKSRRLLTSLACGKPTILLCAARLQVGAPSWKAGAQSQWANMSMTNHTLWSLRA